ncbi:MAG: serine hydrolase [Gammaproteobacteria bacterium]|nr:serine hydrolase [Gammaproteobacteria bacterium]
MRRVRPSEKNRMMNDKVKKLGNRICFYLVAALNILMSSVHSQELYFPDANDHWETVEAGEAGWDRELLDEAIELTGARKSSGLLILYKGRILAERYWPSPDTSVRYKNSLKGFDSEGRAIEDVASVQKSITAILVGMAQERGYLSIGDAVSDYLKEGWSQTTRSFESKITIRDLLSMTSGLSSDLDYETGPGKKWLYNTPAYHLLMRVVSAATNKTRESLTHEWLTQPLGMINSNWIERSQSTATNFYGFATTARDLARVGLMIQADGRWGDYTIMADGDYIEQMLTSSQDQNPSYGYLWWLNGKDFSRGFSSEARRKEGPLITSAPKELVAMQGALDRKLFLAPNLGLIITRLGSSGSSEGASFNDSFWSALMRAKLP